MSKAKDTPDLAAHADAAFAAGAMDKAAGLLDQAIANEPERAELYHRLGRVHRARGNARAAVAAYRSCLAIAEDDPIARIGLASLGEIPAPDRLPDAIVRYVFDGNAAIYEANMRGLGYCVPELLAAAFVDLDPPPAQPLRILDVGCGSGFCGEAFGGHAGRMTGVDLAGGLIEIARSKVIYDELIEAEVLDFLASTEARFDLAVAGNVMIYFGDLGPLLAGIWRVLVPGGRCLFDLEKGEAASHAFHSGGRFTHSADYARSAAAAAGFVVERLDEVVMRHEQGEPVAAYICALRRDG